MGRGDVHTQSGKLLLQLTRGPLAGVGQKHEALAWKQRGWDGEGVLPIVVVPNALPPVQFATRPAASDAGDASLAD